MVSLMHPYSSDSKNLALPVVFILNNRRVEKKKIIQQYTINP